MSEARKRGFKSPKNSSGFSGVVSKSRQYYKKIIQENQNTNLGKKIKGNIDPQKAKEEKFDGKGRKIARYKRAEKAA